MWATIASIIWKDLRIELRTREAFSASFVFSVLVLVIFNFTMDLTGDEARKFGAAFLWVAFAFAGVLSLNRSFALEKEDGGVHALLLSPADRGGVFLGKFAANTLFMFLTELFVVPLFAVFFNVGFGDRLLVLAGVLVLGTIGFTSVGTLFSAIAVHTRMREVMLPILLLPITIPVLLAAVETTAFALGASGEASFWFKLLIVYDVVFVTASFMVFEYVLQE